MNGASSPEDGTGLRPAFYAGDASVRGDWLSLLHPPYTAWHLSYVLLGAAVADRVDLLVLLSTLAAFGLAVGVAAHALDELRGRPLRTRIPDRSLWAVAIAALAGAATIGIAGIHLVGWPLLAFIAAGVALVLAYNLELFGGRVHTDVGFGLAWGSFPALTSSYAQTQRIGVAAALVALAAFGLSYAQRSLSTPVRHIRRRVRRVQVRTETLNGEVSVGGGEVLLAPTERALRATAWSLVVLGIGLVLTRL